MGHECRLSLVNGMDLPDKTSDPGQGVFNTNLKSQREQRECVQSGEANLCSNVGFEK